MKRVIGYTRVSTLEQSQEGISLEAQKAKIKAYCDLNELTLVLILTDEGISAKTLRHRPAATRAIEMIKSKSVDGLVIFKLDRLARNTKEALEIADLFKRKKASLHSISEKLDTHSAIGEFFFTLMAALAQLERKQIGERTSMALAHKKALCEKTGGDVPFGTDHVQGKLVPNINEEQAIMLMSDLKKKGHSLRKICVELERRQIKTKLNKRSWQPQVVSRILSRVASV